MEIIPLNRKQRARGQKQMAKGKELRIPRPMPYVLYFMLCALAIFGSLSLAETTDAENTLNPDDAQVNATTEEISLNPQISLPPGGSMDAVDAFSGYVSLYADHRARRVGDIVTIIITESSKASKSSATQTSKKSGTKGGLSDFFGLGGMPVKMGVDAGSDYTGSGTTTRSGNMEAKITAFVKQVLPNGTLVLEGTRQVTVNDDIQIITISGVVRPEDVRADNSVLSMHMADAKIEYVGEGPTAQKPGIVTRILQTPFHWVAGIFSKIF